MAVKASATISIFNVSDGATGSTGQGVGGLVQQYYLSTSNTTQTGGSWSTTKPTWSEDYYLWTRFQITWINPSSTSYTAPQLSIANDVYEDSTDYADGVTGQYYQNITNEYNTAIEELKDSITSMVSELTTVDITGTDSSGNTVTLSEMITALSTQLSQTSSDLTLSTTKIETLTDSINHAVTKEELENYVRWDGTEGYLELGQKGVDDTSDRYILRMQNDRISFLENGAEVAYLSNTQLNITNAVVMNKINLGQTSDGKVAFEFIYDETYGLIIR